jgi:polyhydroxyalkanoate synthesis regulator phasin
MTNDKNNWLFIAESMAIAASFVGAIVAVISGQMIYGLAPLAISLLLNLINRRRVVQLLRRKINDRTQIDNLSRDIQALRADVAQLKQPNSSQMSREELSAVVSTVEAINEKQKVLRGSLTPLQSKLDELNQKFTQRPELEQIEMLAGIIVALKQSIDQLPQPDRTAAAVNPERVETLERAIAQIQQELSQLQP